MSKKDTITLTSTLSLVFAFFFPLVGISLAGYSIYLLTQMSSKKETAFIIPAVAIFIGLAVWLY
jgi:uncharacterized membrane protein YqaE (UPF0057 family)